MNNKQESTNAYDGKWGREIREYLAREREAASYLNEQQLRHLLSIAEAAQKVVPGPWSVSEANFIVCDFVNDDPETGRAVAEVDCYDRHVAEKRRHIAAFDPGTCIQLIRMALNGQERK